MWRMIRIVSLIVLGMSLVTGGVLPSAAAQVRLRLWSHWADQENKKDVILIVVKLFEARNPGVKVEVTWWEKAHMWPALRAAFSAGSGFPDVFYFDSGVLEFIGAGWLADLSEGIRWENVENWARRAWTFPGPQGKPGVWALALEAYTDELYYNKKLFRQLGIAVPSNYTFSEDQFREVVTKCTSAGYAAFSNGIGDRDYPGTYVLSFLLLSKLGARDLYRLWTEELSFKSRDVVDVFRYFKELVDLKAYPKTFATMTLGESHRYFHTEQRACMFPVGSWYTGRAFVPPEKGGQPRDFELGMLRYPAMRGGKGIGVKFLNVGGSLAAAARSPNLHLAKRLIDAFADVAIGNLWMAKTAVQTGIKTEPARIQSEWKWYFEEYARVNSGVSFAIMDWHAVMKPGFREVWVKIANEALPGGLITHDDAIEKLEEARLRGK
jgi:multiple sugar transport system substrate-binding protein